MTGSYVSAALRRDVVERAGSRCEYCLFPSDVSLLSFEIEHTISEKHGGLTDLQNLALACPFCNRAKGSDLASIDPKTGALTAVSIRARKAGRSTSGSMALSSCFAQAPAE